MYFAAPKSLLAPARRIGSRLGALPQNLEFTNPTGTYSYDPTLAAYPWLKNFVLPQYGPLPKAPVGSQGVVEFPWTIKQPLFTGNYYWWIGGPVLNIGYPYYSNDCWEYLRNAIVDSDFDSVVNWLGWAILSFQWGVSDAKAFDFGAFRWVGGSGGPAGSRQGGFYNHDQLMANYAKNVAAPVVASAPKVASTIKPPTMTAGGGGAISAGANVTRGTLKGLCDIAPSQSVTVIAPPYGSTPQWNLWWSVADTDAFFRSLEKHVDSKATGTCLDSLTSRWSVMINNLLKAPGGPQGLVISLATCPPQDNFFQGLGVMVAALVVVAGTVYSGGALLGAGSGIGAGAGAATADAGVAAEGAVDVGAAAGAADVGTAAVVADTGAAAVDTGAAVGAGSEAATLTEVTVTASPIVGSTVTATDVLSAVGAGAGVVSAGGTPASFPSTTTVTDSTGVEADPAPETYTPQTADPLPSDITTSPPNIDPGDIPSVEDLQSSTLPQWLKDYLYKYGKSYVLGQLSKLIAGHKGAPATAAELASYANGINSLGTTTALTGPGIASGGTSNLLLIALGALALAFVLGDS